ncbi:hypothetical protein CI610_01619 [invertebrate metagenome]|uniref:CAP-Gly domain-containing protein n=1 Tax=invertebrate metagenome TaxID=1711999 RepID=A0A2H9T881_9ZZZZ
MKVLVVFLLVIFADAWAGGGEEYQYKNDYWDLRECNNHYPSIVFTSHIKKNKSKVRRPRYMDELHQCFHDGEISLSEDFARVYREKHHMNCGVFEGFLAFVFLCVGSPQGLFEDHVFSGSENDKVIRNVAAEGGNATGVFWLNPFNPNLCPGAKVVWPSDKGNKFATIKWIGVLEPNKNWHLDIGVEFEQPVGSGTGKFRDRRLFSAEQGHASLIPPLGLITSSDFLCEHYGESFVAHNKTIANEQVALLLEKGLSPKSQFSDKSRHEVLSVMLSEIGEIRSTDDDFSSFSSYVSSDRDSMSTASSSLSSDTKIVSNTVN